VEAYWRAWHGGLAGEIFNIGGGPANTLSLVELLETLNQFAPDAISVNSLEWGRERPGDQPVYVSDISDLRRSLGWSPTVSPQQGVEMLWKWVKENREEIDQLAPAVALPVETVDLFGLRPDSISGQFDTASTACE